MSSDSRLQLLTELVERFLPFQENGFKQTSRFFGKSENGMVFREKWGMTVVIYDSDYCRVKFLFDSEKSSFPLSIYYGRLHAPNDEWLIKWNGEDCYCWHSDFEIALKFLDGIAPRDAAENYLLRPEGLKDFNYASGHDNNTQPEQMLIAHAKCWDYYGNRMFGLFDLRSPSELWERYVKFLKEYDSLTWTHELQDRYLRMYQIC